MEPSRFETLQGSWEHFPHQADMGVRGIGSTRQAALRQWHGRDVVKELATRGILIRSSSFRGVAEEAPGAYKDVSEVVDAADDANLARKVARLEPLVCIKG